MAETGDKRGDAADVLLLDAGLFLTLTLTASGKRRRKTIVNFCSILIDLMPKAVNGMVKQSVSCPIGLQSLHIDSMYFGGIITK